MPRQTKKPEEAQVAVETPAETANDPVVEEAQPKTPVEAPSPAPVEPKNIAETDDMIVAAEAEIAVMDAEIIAAHAREDHEAGDKLRMKRYFAARNLAHLAAHRGNLQRG